MAAACRFLIAALLALLPALPAAAHLTPNSEVRLDFADDRVEAEIIIPQGDYAAASGHRIGNDPAAIATAKGWLAAHMGARTPDGRPWRVTITGLRFAQVAGPPDLLADAVLVPPPGGDVRRFTLRWSAAIDRVPGHFALFVARSDLAGRVGQRDEILGALRGERRSLAIDRGEASSGIAFLNALLLGGAHIAEGHDHLLFLLALLLPAPFLAAGGRWSGLRGLGATARHLGWIVTAFTIGHSITLVLATLLGWTLPPAPVEILIALSILVSAVHAARPLFPGREAWVAAAFGLVHGLAFATLVSDLDLAMAGRAITLAGFNIGIELVQIAVVAASLPMLLLFARSRFASAFRLAGAAFAGFAALAWMAERVSGEANGVAGAIDAGLESGAWLLAGLTALAVIAFAASRRREAGA